MGTHSTFLFVTPSFAEGVGRIVDFGNTLHSYNISSNPTEADTRAMTADWEAVGIDLCEAVHRFEADHLSQ